MDDRCQLRMAICHASGYPDYMHTTLTLFRSPKGFEERTVVIPPHSKMTTHTRQQNAGAKDTERNVRNW